MTQGVSIQIFGESEGVERMLQVLDTALNPVAIAGFLGSVVDPYLRGRAKERFYQEGDDVTGAWQPLSSATVEIREQMGYGGQHPINKREGDLAEYIISSPNSLSIAPWGASLKLPGGPPMGDLKDKVIAAQQGGVGPSGRPFPARPVLGMNEQDLTFVLLALSNHINNVGSRMI
jgi:hypothetical protein